MTLAVAFLMMMLSTSYIDRRVAQDVRQRTAGQRLLAEWVDKLSSPMSPRTLARKLARIGQRLTSDSARELAFWGHLDESAGELDELVDVAIREMRYEAFFERLDPGERSVLVGVREGEDIFRFLLDPANLDSFFKQLRNVRSASLPGSDDDLRKFVQDFAATESMRKKILEGHAAAVASLAKKLGNTLVLEMLGRGEVDVPAMLAGEGFRLSLEDLAVLKVEAAAEMDSRSLAELIGDARIRGVIARQARVKPQEVTEANLFGIVSGESGAKWLKDEVITSAERSQKKVDELTKQLAALEDLLKESPERLVSMAAEKDDRLKALTEHEKIREVVAGLLQDRQKDSKSSVKESDVKVQQVFDALADVKSAETLRRAIQIRAQEMPLEDIEKERARILPPVTMPTDRMAKVAKAWRERDRLAVMESSLPPEDASGWLGFSGRTGWLIIISFLVCAVGVANAMLMSVTERFREIATMKCLGALDSFIMVSFVLESSIQGLAGGCVGVVIGLLLGTLRSSWGFGLLAVTNLPGLMLLASAGVCLVAGIILASLAALYPAWVAARLAPMEAMRIE